VTSQGQRFRRRALRRGYKIDEVDSFLDRVEATLAGEQIGAPVGAQEVHDVVFRVRFGGYDEWQVDLHLDRVERQLAEFEERGGRAPDPRMAPEQMRGIPADRMGPSMGRSAPPTERIPAPSMHEDRPLGGPPMPQRQQMPAPEPYGGRYEEPAYGARRGPAGYDTGGYDAFEPGRHGKADMTAEIRLPDRERSGYGPAPTSGSAYGGAADFGGSSGFGGSPAFGRSASGFGGSSGVEGRSPGYEFEGGGPGFEGGRPGGPGYEGGAGAGPNGELYRVDQLRRTFQPRRFGSGYDPMQVDRLFESILQAMSGRGAMPVPENELDTLQFGLVPGGYFEAEVDAALREVKDILLRRR
jgi:DivIVA domain-containing protein